MDYVVEVKGLVREFSSKKGFIKKSVETVRSVNNISFNIKRGEAFGFLGPNGAGKTTTVKMLTTVLLPTAGEVKILGKDICREAKDIRKLINVVYGGDKGLYTRLTARDNLKYFCDLYHIPTIEQSKKIEELLAMVNLSDVAERRVENFSRGMKQRLHIARGLINDPQILFLDEPTMGLDPVSGLGIRNLIKDLKSKGITIFLTTHYMQEAEEVCDRVAMIKKGNIVVLDTIENIKGRFKKAYTVEMAAEKINEEQLSYLKSRCKDLKVEVLKEDCTDISFTVQDITTELNEILDKLKGLEIINFNTKSITLEDAYIEIISKNQ